MTDQPADPSIDPETQTAVSTDGSPVSPPTDTEEKDKWPPGPPVFGKWAFFITVVPFVFYLFGNFLAGHVESSRAHTRVRQQTSHAKGAMAQFEKILERDYGKEPAKKQILENSLNIPAITSKLEAEEFEAEKLEPLLEPLADDSNVRLNYPEKALLVEQLEVLVKMRHLEEEHKTREVLSMSHKHFKKLKGEVDQSSDLDDTITDTASGTEWLPEHKTWYPTAYLIIIAGTALLMLVAFPGYFKTPFKVTWLSFVVGAVGIVVWIGLIELDRRFLHIGDMLMPTGREAFNPLQELKSNPTWMWQWLSIRFIGLVLIVPFIEEFFLRGWLMRYIHHPDWDDIPIGDATYKAILGVVGYGVMSHMGEPLAAAAWFGMVTWLYLRTRSIWDCVVAHAVTNLLLGVYVMYTGSWYLW